MKPGPGWRSLIGLRRIDGWAGFLLAIVCVVLGAAAFDFISSASTLARGSKALGSLEYSGTLVACALLVGLFVWAALRIFKGNDGALEGKETVLWSACLLVTLVTGLRMFH
jgi:cation transport ATPase